MADWNESAVYVESIAINVTCTEGYFAPGDVPVQVVSCRGDGWEVAEACYAACTAKAPAAGKNIRHGRYAHAVGAFVHYKCTPGYFLRQPGVGTRSLSARYVWVLRTLFFSIIM